MHGTRLGTWYQAPIGKIGPVNKSLRQELQSMTARCSLQFAVRQANKENTIAGLDYRFCHDVGQPGICTRVVVQRAVRLDVMQCGPVFRNDSRQRSNLFYQRSQEFRSRKKAAAPAKSFAIGVGRMSADGHAIFNRRRNGRAHTGRVACMSATSNIAARNDPQDFSIGGITFAKIGIDVYACHPLFFLCATTLVQAHDIH